MTTPFSEIDDINLIVLHDSNDFKRQSIDRQRMKFTDHVALLKFITDVDGNIVDNRFPLEGVVYSVPMFVNAESFTIQNINEWLISVVPTGTNVAIEFRTASREDMRDAEEWKSVAALGSTDNTIEFDGLSSGPFTTDDDLTVSNITSGYGIQVLSNDAQGESVYFTQSGVSFSSSQAKYLAADFVSTKKGSIMEWHVNHGYVTYADEPIGGNPSPFNHLIQIEKENVKQTVYWDITDWPSGQRNFDYMRMLGLKVIDASQPFNVNVTEIKLFETDDTVASVATSAVPSTINRFVQYRAVFSSTVTTTTPELSGVQIRVESHATMLPGQLLRGNKSFRHSVLTFPKRRGIKLIYE